MKNNGLIDIEPWVVIPANRNCDGAVFDVLVSVSDLPRIQKRNGLVIRHDGRAEFTDARGERLLHRFLLTPEGEHLPYGHWIVADHKNGKFLDNRRENLRLVSVRMNNRNKLNGHPANYVSGVYYSKATGKYVASVSVRGHRDHLGSFDTELEAKAVAAARIKQDEQEALAVITDICHKLGWDKKQIIFVPEVAA